MFSEYPDLLDTKDLSKALRKSTKTVYRLLKNGDIKHKKIGREYVTAKINVIRYLLNESETPHTRNDTQ